MQNLFLKSIQWLFFCSIAWLCNLQSAKATHIIGGVMNYECIDEVTGTYRVTLRVYKDCSPSVTADFDDPATLHFMYPGFLEYLWVNAPLFSDFEVPINITDPCVVVPDVCVEEGIYVYEIVLGTIPAGGLTVLYQRCCRNGSILNIDDPTARGASFFAVIPDTTVASCNSNPVFTEFPPIVICVNKPIDFDHSATDIDGDSLVYSLCTPSDGGYASGPVVAGGTVPDPIIDLPWFAPYSATDMLGGVPNLSINPSTGQLTGYPPTIGRFVVGVCVSEYRGGVFVSSTKRDFQYNVTTCALGVLASTPAVYANCEDLLITFVNNSSGAIPIDSVYWDFGVVGVFNDTSTAFNPIFIYPDTGTYSITLIANPGLSCADTAFGEVRIYPILDPGFTFNDACASFPVSFIDTSICTYGSINNWTWTFGDASVAATGTPSPVHIYTTPGSYTSTLVVSTTTGCVDTLSRSVVVTSNPIVTITSDTLVCADDNTLLSAYSPTGFNYVWTPNYNISDDSIATPIISPDVTTNYICITTDALGCSKKDTVKVTVANNTFAATAASDNSICIGDTVLLNGTGGFVYSWTPTINTIGNTTSTPLVFPTTTTTYTLTAYIGTCSDTDTITIEALVRPKANANPDISICYGDSIQFTCTGGTDYVWSPSIYLSDSTIANPYMLATTSQTYIVQVTDDAGCLATADDTVNVIVLINNNAFAGPDALSYNGGIYQMYAAPALTYSWSPGGYLNDSTIQYPVFSGDTTTTFVLTTTNAIGCKDYDTMRLRVYAPELAMPNAFSPDGDNINDLFMPIYKGIESLYEFEVFNRWGEKIFETSSITKGWNGTFNDELQPMGTYIYVIKARTMLEEDITVSGNVTLVR